MTFKDPIVFRVSHCFDCGLKIYGFEREDPDHALYKPGCDSCSEPWSDVKRYSAAELCGAALFASDDAEIETEESETP